MGWDGVIVDKSREECRTKLVKSQFNKEQFSGVQIVHPKGAYRMGSIFTYWTGMIVTPTEGLLPYIMEGLSPS